MPDWIHDPWDSTPSSPYATQIHETDHATHSPVLGPDGRPLRVERQPLGFDLRPRLTNEFPTSPSTRTR